ncbi:universal stress protein [Megalodesulfovibrio gigas]|uniref:Putative UspA domain-containing protein n=1 Tax=Megalodesulfovibrio gigas (strain ATCC 19364 / DSM 1382 / NCIMB 9332 / VKM B-1759) TaxID=1121448 RepID=T2G8H3_MEGG1|nr:universal stress protein [Megalodesulfovibrio gigas]AGW12890.1 putative UspA domain-containing protein [Megalodesulfovibrio gigas DSM 1382 = ATCC 19364]
MNRHFLVTVSDDPQAMHAIRFLGHFFHRKDGLECTLFYVAPRDHDSPTAMIKPDARELAKGTAALEAARDKLHHMGWPAEHLHIKTMTQRQSRAMEIVDEASRGRYDAVVLGRRGITSFEAFMGSSISHEILEERISFPLWLCRMPEASRTGVLCCVDGSEQSLRIVDHAGFVLAGHHEHPITLCCVENGQRPEVETLFARCREILEQHGVPAHMIHDKRLQGDSPARALRAELQAGGYAVIAMGRTGAGGGALRKLFFGSVSSDLIQTAPPATVWISR